MDKDIEIKDEKEVKNKKKNKKEEKKDVVIDSCNSGNKNISFILIISILVSFVCGMLGAYLINKSVSVEKVVKNITTSELVENSIATSVDKVYDSTVIIVSSANGKQISTGTGFIYKTDKNNAYIMTNNHVIEGADAVSIQFNDSNDMIDAKIVGGDVYADIAVLTISNKNSYKAVEIGDSKVIKLGDTIFTIGSPMGITYKGTVTKGILSGKDRMIEVNLTSNTNDYYMSVLQIDAAVNPGNSGGPLCDVSGNVIGIISLKIVENAVEGMGFAIPIEDALDYATLIETGKKIVRPYLGISMLDLSEEYYLWQNRITVPEEVEKGIAVLSVENNSPAYKAGLKKGDIITKLGNKEVGSLADFRYELYKHKVGEKITVTFYRNGQKKTLNVTLGQNNNN